MKIPNYVFDDELYHHGIPGQKHGERRWQNEDGSLTPEGYIHYGYGKRDAKEKHNLQVYKYKLKSNRQQTRDSLSGAEDRNRIREQAKSARLLRKAERQEIRDQARNQRLMNKEQAKTNQINRDKAMKNSRKMSDDDLRDAIQRLKLEAEYNKALIVANDSKSIAAKADRFFESPRGQAALSLAVAVLPNAVNTVARNFSAKAADSMFKYSNKLDREAKEESIRSTKAEADSKAAQARVDNENAKVISEQAKSAMASEKVRQEQQRLLLQQLKKNGISAVANNPPQQNNPQPQQPRQQPQPQQQQPQQQKKKKKP